MVNCYVLQINYKKDVWYSPQYLLEEINNLTKALSKDIQIIASEIINIRNVNAGSFFGEGTLEKLETVIKAKEIDCLIVSFSLSSIQQRNLEKRLNCKVVDKKALIISIFGQRANTKESKLQVDLALLEYQKSRVVKAWSHLERQRGGGGFTGGPGETQKEIDKRIIQDKIISLKQKLKHVEKTRFLQSSRRKEVPFPIVTLVGYTNAGKSSTFNYLLGENTFVKDMLFATLDTKMRLMQLENGEKAILSDTVGFIADLPHELVEAFKSTLEDVNGADVILHIVDYSNPHYEFFIKAVKNVLQEIGIGEEEYKNKVIEVFNKVDKTKKEELSNALGEEAIFFSAISGYGKKNLLNAIYNKIIKDKLQITVEVPMVDSNLISLVYKYAIINKQEMTQNGKKILFNLVIKPKNFHIFEKNFKML